MKIAIIEDDEITRLELSKILMAHGYETVWLTDFENPTQALEPYSIDLILLYINLPYENGYKVCEKIQEKTPVPIIFVTSRDTSSDELRSIQAGGIDFVRKILEIVFQIFFLDWLYYSCFSMVWAPCLSFCC